MNIKKYERRLRRSAEMIDSLRKVISFPLRVLTKYTVYIVTVTLFSLLDHNKIETFTSFSLPNSPKIQSFSIPVQKLKIFLSFTVLEKVTVIRSGMKLNFLAIKK
jgi:hypothetical protein